MRPGPPWGRVEHVSNVDSTNAEVLRSPRPWRVLVAEEQTAGRGRLGRSWVTRPGSDLAVSVVLPHDEGMPLGWFPLIAGLAVRAALAQTAGLDTVLKWPNDVLVRGHALDPGDGERRSDGDPGDGEYRSDGERKLAGILCQWSPSGVVVGTGINVTTSRADLPHAGATSVAAAGGELAGEAARERLLTAYLTHLAALHTDLREHPDVVRAAYRQVCATIGAQVRVAEPGGMRQGRAVTVDDEGRLVLLTTDGRVALSAGDVVHVRPGDTGLGGADLGGAAPGTPDPGAPR